MVSDLMKNLRPQTYVSYEGEVWSFIKVISTQATYGSVHLVGRGNKRRAIKVYKKSYNVEIFSNELLLMGIDHPTAVRAISLGKYMDGIGTIKDAVMMETAVSDLFSLKAIYGDRLTPTVRKRMFYELCCGVNQLHSLDFIHVDIRNENFLVYMRNDCLKVKICDYSLSMFLDKIGSKPCTSLRITEHLLPPEFAGIYSAWKKDNNFQTNYIYTKNVDVFTLAHVASLLFNDSLEYGMINVRVKFHEIIKDYEPHLKSLLVSMIDINPSLRPSVQTIMKDPYFDDVRDPVLEKVTTNKPFLSTKIPTSQKFIQCLQIIRTTNARTNNFAAFVYQESMKLRELDVCRNHLQRLLAISDEEANLLYIVFSISLSIEICSNTCYMLSLIMKRFREFKGLSDVLKNAVVGDEKIETQSNSIGQKIKNGYIDFVITLMNLHIKKDHPFSFFM